MTPEGSTMLEHRYQWWSGALVISLVAVLLSPGVSWGTSTESQVLALVKASVSISTVPSDLTPTISQAETDLGDISVNGSGYLLKSCDPYWVHSLAQHPKPCWYGDLKSKKVVAVWGDSNAAAWVPALNIVMEKLHFRLALFGFIGCDTSFMPETSTQTGFPGEWELCNDWHTSLPAAVRALKPFVVMDASTMYGRLGNATYNTSWVQGMTKAFTELSAASKHTIRVEFQTLTAQNASPPACLSSNSSDVQACDIDLATNQAYPTVRARDATIATDAHAIEIPTWQLVCYDNECSPVIGKYMAFVDQDHLSTPYSLYLAGAIQTLLEDHNALPSKHK
jgi:hypothetical protein